MLPRVVVQVLSQLQETSHHDAVQNGDDDHLDDGDGDGDDADHVGHLGDLGDLGDPLLVNTVQASLIKFLLWSMLVM